MNGLKKVISILFGASKTEFAGFRLLILTALFCSFGLALANYFSKSPYLNYDSDVKQLDSLLLVMDSQLEFETTENRIVLEKFDPNTVSEEKLIGFGFPPWLATRLINYRSSGARFSKPSDLLKLYGFPNTLFAQIKPYVSIKGLPKLKKNVVLVENSNIERVLKKVEDPLPVFDLNAADTSIFQTIKGIGSKLSNRIVEYRASLGGFISKNQLYQIYRLDSAVVEKISHISTIAVDFEPVKININKATKEQLAAHPYINWTQAKLIIAYRNQHGAFLESKDILKVYSIDESWIKKSASYLSF